MNVQIYKRTKNSHFGPPCMYDTRLADTRRKKNEQKICILQKRKSIKNSHKEMRDLDVNIPLSTICQRVVRKNLVVNNHHCGGYQSPLVPIEDIIVGILFQISCIQECLPPSRALCLINSLGKDHPILTNLIKWKKKYSIETKGTIGTSYWKSFLKRNRHQLGSKRGQNSS